MFVDVQNLTKQYRTARALNDVCLQIERGEVLGLLGPNGAGKTTLLRVLLGYLTPTAGGARIDGLSCSSESVQVRHRISYLPADARLFKYMRARDILDFFANVRPEGNLTRARELAERLDLDLGTWVAFMSTGMRQKLAIAAVMSCDAPLLILDEPTSNLDPTVRSIVGEMVKEAQERGQTVLFSSHVLPEVEEVSDRVAIMRKGELVHTQRISDLRQHHRIRAAIKGRLPEPPAEFAESLEIRYLDDHHIQIETPLELSKLFGWLAEQQLGQVNIEPFGLRAVYDRFHMVS